jgi:hypothetical protein
MLALYFPQCRFKITCGNIAMYSCRHYAIDGCLAIDIHESLEEEHFPFHGFFFFSLLLLSIQQFLALRALSLIHRIL